MGQITDQSASVFRDYATDGVPASGAHEPVKSEIRALGVQIDASITALAAAFVADGATVIYPLRSTLYADLAHAAGAFGIVWNDGANNGLYVKAGASGSGSWGATGLLLAGSKGDPGIDGDAGDVANITAARDLALTLIAQASAALSPASVNQTAGARRVVNTSFGVTAINSDFTEVWASYTTTSGDYYFTPGDLAYSGAFTVVLPVVSGTVTSAAVAQYNAAGTEVGSRTTATFISGQVAARGIVRNTAAVRLVMIVVLATDVTVQRMAVYAGEPATVPVDAPLEAARGYIEEQLNEVAILSPTVAFSPAATSATYVNGVATLPQNSSAAPQFDIDMLGFSAGDVFTMRVRTNSGKLSPTIQFTYPGDPNTITPPASEVQIRYEDVPGDPAHCFVLATFKVLARSGATPNHLYFNMGTPGEAAIVDDLTIVKGLEIPPVRKAPRAVRDDTARQITAALAAGGTVLAAPVEIVDMWGDSLTDYNRANGSIARQLATRLQTRLGRAIPVNNLGVAAQNTAQIASRAGGTPALFTLSGNAIPAGTTAVAVTARSAEPITGFSRNTTTPSTDPLSGTLGGVPVNYSSTARDSGGNPTAYAVTRKVAGSVVPIQQNTPFIPDDGETTRDRYQILWWGRNDTTSSGGTAQGLAVIQFLRNQIALMRPIDKRFIVLGIMKAVNDPSAAVVDDANAQLKLAFPRNYVDMNPPTAEELATIGYTATSQDNTDIANGFIPTGLRPSPTDLLHLNDYGNALISLRLDRAFQRLGWMQ